MLAVTSSAPISTAWSHSLSTRTSFVFALIAACTLSACKWNEFREFFQAREIDHNTHIEVSTTPALGKHGIAGGALFIDDEKVSDATPYVLARVTPGRHRIKVVAPGYVSQEMEIDAKEGQTAQPSLALRQLPNEPSAVPRPHADPAANVGKKKKADDGAGEPGVAGLTHTLLFTATPAVSVALDGSTLGSAVGLRVTFTKAQGQLKLGDGAEAMVLGYSNKERAVTFRASALGARTLEVDGVPITAKDKSFEIDQRPRRISLSNVEGSKQVILVKLVE